MAFSFALRLVL